MPLQDSDYVHPRQSTLKDRLRSFRVQGCKSAQPLSPYTVHYLRESPISYGQKTKLGVGSPAGGSWGSPPRPRPGIHEGEEWGLRGPASPTHPTLILPETLRSSVGAITNCLGVSISIFIIIFNSNKHLVDTLHPE